MIIEKIHIDKRTRIPRDFCPSDCHDDTVHTDIGVDFPTGPVPGLSRDEDDAGTATISTRGERDLPQKNVAGQKDLESSRVDKPGPRRRPIWATADDIKQKEREKRD
jgi:hypothetical protein